jgi:hypothetical protein
MLLAVMFAGTVVVFWRVVCVVRRRSVPLMSRFDDDDAASMLKLIGWSLLASQLLNLSNNFIHTFPSRFGSGTS